MTINYTTLLGLAQPVTGTEAGTWGTVVNDEITALLEEAIAGGETIDVTGGNVTLTNTDGVANQARNAILIITGTPGVSRNVIAPSTSKVYIVINGSNGAVVIKGAATTGVTIVSGERALIAWNGSDFVAISSGDVDGPASSTDNAIARFDGTSGKLIQNSAVTIADTTGDITTAGYVITAAGTSSTPAYTTTGDLNTGVFFPAADTIAFAEGGVEAMRITSAGNVGIGTSSPSTALEIAGAFGGAGGLTLTQNNGNGNGGRGPSLDFKISQSEDGSVLVTGGRIATLKDNGSAASGAASMSFYTSDGTPTLTERMRIDSSGNVGIGTSSPSAKLEIHDSTEVAIKLRDTSAFVTNTGPYIDFQGYDSASVIKTFSQVYGVSKGSNDGEFYITTRNAGTLTERMRITSSGEVLVGGTTEINAVPGAVTIQRTDFASILSLFRNDTTVSSTNAFGQIRFYGNDTTSNTPTQHAYIQAVASGTHAAGDNPTDLVFGCTNDGSETVDEFARLAQAGSTGRSFTVSQGTLTDLQSSYIQATAGTAGTANRISQIGSYKHSGITNCCGYILLDPEDGTDNFLWVDNSDVLRISTTASNIGTTGGTVVGTQTSDERIKNIIGPVTYGLEQIKSINPVEFTLKDDAEQTKRIGFIAQQVQPIVPESVYDTKEVIVEGEPTKLGMEYVALIPVLVNAVKELSAKNDALEARIAALENTNA